MKKIAVLALLLAATPSYAAGNLWRDAGQACVFGGSVLGVTSILVLYPAIAMGTNTIPVTSLILGNTLFGCGVSAIGASAAYGFGWAYDRAFGPEEPPPAPQVPPGHSRAGDASTGAPAAGAPAAGAPAVPGAGSGTGAPSNQAPGAPAGNPPATPNHTSLKWLDI